MFTMAIKQCSVRTHVTNFRCHVCCHVIVALLFYRTPMYRGIHLVGLFFERGFSTYCQLHIHFLNLLSCLNKTSNCWQLEGSQNGFVCKLYQSDKLHLLALQQNHLRQICRMLCSYRRGNIRVEYGSLCCLLFATLQT